MQCADLRVPIDFVRTHPQLFNLSHVSRQPDPTPVGPATQHHEHGLSAAQRTDGAQSDSHARRDGSSVPGAHAYHTLASVAALTGVVAGASYLPESIVSLRWTPVGFASNAVIVMTLYEDVPLWSDTAYLYRTGLASEGTLGWLFPAANTPSSSSNSFYFTMGWNCHNTPAQHTIQRASEQAAESAQAHDVTCVCCAFVRAQAPRVPGMRRIAAAPWRVLDSSSLPWA